MLAGEEMLLAYSCDGVFSVMPGVAGAGSSFAAPSLL
jgi:hypothetical protein